MAEEFLDEEEALITLTHEQARLLHSHGRDKRASSSRLRRLRQDDARRRAGQAARREGQGRSLRLLQQGPSATTCARPRRTPGSTSRTSTASASRWRSRPRSSSPTTTRGRGPAELLRRGAADGADRGDRGARPAVRRALRRRGPGPPQRLARRADGDAPRPRRSARLALHGRQPARLRQPSSRCPTSSVRYDLDVNCRNTQAIHREVIKKYEGEIEPEVDRPRGPRRRAASRPTTSRGPSRAVDRAALRAGGGPPPGHRRPLLARHRELRASPRPAAASTSFVDEPKPLGNYVRFSSIRGFKGLETPVVILCELEDIDEETLDQQLYVGISRARNHCVVVAPDPG